MVFRFARHTNDIEKLRRFYTDVLELQVLAEFIDHDGYNGIFLGLKNEKWHLEFTESGQSADHSFDEDDLLVFYPTEEEQYNRILSNIDLHRIKKQDPKNPYWKINGIQFNDPDGYGIIICGLQIKM